MEVPPRAASSPDHAAQARPRCDAKSIRRGPLPSSTTTPNGSVLSTLTVTPIATPATSATTRDRGVNRRGRAMIGAVGSTMEDAASAPAPRLLRLAEQYQHARDELSEPPALPVGQLDRHGPPDWHVMGQLPSRCSVCD